MYKTSVYTLVTAIFKDKHIENSKNYKRWYCLHRSDCDGCDNASISGNIENDLYHPTVNAATGSSDIAANVL